MEYFKNKIIFLVFIALISAGSLFFLQWWREEIHSYKNLLRNPSFENGLTNWSVDSREYIVLDKARDTVKLELSLAYLEEKISIPYFPEVVQGELTKSVLIFQFFNKDKELIAKLTYVLNGAEDYWTHQNIVKDNVTYATYLRNTALKQWNNIEINNLLQEYNNKAREIENSSLLDKEDIIRVVSVLSVWTVGGEIKVRYKLPKFLKRVEYEEEIVDFNEYQETEHSALRSFFYLPSDGRKLLRILGEKYNYIYQRVDNLKPTKEYLLLFDAKNEFGLIAPLVSIVDRNNNVIASRRITVQMAQTGWVRAGIIFTPRDSFILLKLGNGSLFGQYYANNYDNIYLYEIPAKKERAFFRYIKKKHNIVAERDKEIKEKAVDYLKLISPQFQERLDAEYSSLEIPIYDLSFDEYQLWHKASMPEIYWSYRIKGGYKEMVAAKLKKGDREDWLDVRIKPRGIMSYHHASRIKSFRINIDKKERFDLLRPATRDFLSEAFSYYVASKLGLISLRNEFVFLRINNKPIGIYWKFQRNARDLELNERPEGYLIGTLGGPYLFDYEDFRWERYAKPSNKKYIKKYPHFQLMRFVTNLFKKGSYHTAYLIDMEQLLKWNVHSILMGSDHQVSYENNLMYWDTSAGRLEWVPWDVRFDYLNRDIDTDFSKMNSKDSLLFAHYNPFVEEFFEDFQYYNKRNRLLWNYVNKDYNLEEDIKFYDSLYQKTLSAFSKTVEFEAPHTPHSNLNILPFSEIDKVLSKVKRVYSVRFKNLKARLAQSNQVKILLNKFQEKIFYGDRYYNVYRIRILPKTNSALSSNWIEMFNLRDNYSGSPLLVGVPDGLLPYDDNQRAFIVNQYLVSDVFFKYKIEFFWRDYFHNILKRLESTPDKLNFLRKHYIFVAGKEYRLRPSSLEDPLVVKKIFSILQDLGELRWKKELTFYLLYEEKDNLNPLRDMSFVVKNSTTDQIITPQVLEGSVIVDSSIGSRIIKLLQKKADPIQKREELRQDSVTITSPLKYFSEVFLSRAQFLRRYPFFKRGAEENTIILQPNTYQIKENIIIPQGLILLIQPGAILYFTEGSSLVVYGKIIARGTEEAPIVFTAQDQKKGWGVVGIVREEAKGEFEHCLFEYGGDAFINGIYFSGMLSSYYANIKVRNCRFQYANYQGGDDALNVKKSTALVEDSYFYNNKFDAIDFDFMQKGSKIVGNHFLKNGNDSIDISASRNIVIANNQIKDSGDKGISLGERSEVLIVKNFIKGNRFGIAVKDLAQARVTNNTILDNKIGIAAYNKKNIFGGGKVFVNSSILKNNTLDFGIEKIDREDPRYNRAEYQSVCFVLNSKYKTTQRMTKEVISIPQTQPKSKKAILRAFLGRDLQSAGYHFVVLIDKVKQLRDGK